MPVLHCLRMTIKGQSNQWVSSPKSSTPTSRTTVIENKAWALFLLLQHFHVYYAYGMPILLLTDHTSPSFWTLSITKTMRLVPFTVIKIRCPTCSGKNSIMVDAQYCTLPNTIFSYCYHFCYLLVILKRALVALLILGWVCGQLWRLHCVPFPPNFLEVLRQSDHIIHYIHYKVVHYFMQCNVMFSLATIVYL